MRIYDNIFLEIQKSMYINSYSSLKSRNIYCIVNNKKYIIWSVDINKIKIFTNHK